MKVRDRLESIASTPQACAPRTPDIPHHDTNTSTLHHCFRGPVFYRPARCVKPASRDFYPNRDRDDARRGELEFYRILAFRSATPSSSRGDDRDLFHRHLCSRGRCWPCDGYCRLPALPDNERRSIRPAQRMNPGIVSNLWLLPAVPFAVAVVILSLGKSRHKSAAVLAIGGQIVGLAFSIVAFLPTLQTHGFRAIQNFTWFTFGEQILRLGFVLDPLAAAMLVMISLVGLCIFVFSVGYMADDKNFTRFFAYLSFFSGAMLGVVIANSLLLLFMFWELVGLASYLLIGFWIERPSAAAAAKKAFVTTRIGDMGFFLGMLWLYHSSSTLVFYDGGHGCIENAGLAMLGANATSIALLIFCGAVGKSGQFPLHVWLPDAMEGPTPVSALIHAATMVAAGVFLVARVYPLMDADPANVPGASTALTVVTWVGAITAIFAALIAVAQNDIKRILAYSTVSQLGYMMVGIGVGGVAVGMFHLLTHAFFKALLFLGAGSVIHGCHDEQDICRMGGLRKFMPVTFATYAIGMMALCGVPIFFSGFWSKDEILHKASHWSISHWPFYLGVFGALLTAFYM